MFIFGYFLKRLLSNYDPYFPPKNPPYRMTLIKWLMLHHFIQFNYHLSARWSEKYRVLMQHPNTIKTIWLPAEISQNPLHHSRRGTRQGGAFGPQAPIPGGYGATDPEKSLQEVGPLYPV